MSAPTEFNAQEIWVRCFNPTTNAVRTGTSEANPPAATAFQWQDVLNRIFDPVTNTLKFE